MELFNTSIDRTRSNAEKYTLRQKLFGTDNVLPMWVADMDIATPKCITSAVQERATHEIYGYEMMPEAAYNAQIFWMKERHKLHVKREWMLYSPSVVATINIAIKAFTAEGDGVIIQPPVYSPFQSSIENNAREVVKNPLKIDEKGIYRFDFEDLKSKITCKTKLLILCSPHNPVGRVWSRHELQELANICLENGIKVLCDEIHSDLVYAPNVHIPFMSLSDAVRDITVTAIGPGKTFNLAGLSISTAVMSDEKMHQQFLHVYESVHFAQGTIFGHVAFEAAYTQGTPWLEALLGHLERNQLKLKSLLDQHTDKITCKLPEGSYLAWLKCDKMGLKDSALRSFFIQSARLGLSPGLSFGKEGHGFMRLNFAVPSDVMDEAIKRLQRSLDDYN